jgi:hypothetical protein
MLSVIARPSHTAQCHSTPASVRTLVSAVFSQFGQANIPGRP